MRFPLSPLDVILWLGVITLILLVASELISAYSGQVMIVIEKRRLRATALVFSTLFALAVMVQIYEMLTSVPISP